MARQRFKTTRVFVKSYSKDSKIRSITINNTITNKAYTTIFGKKVYLTLEEIATLNTSVTIHYEE